MGVADNGHVEAKGDIEKGEHSRYHAGGKPEDTELFEIWKYSPHARD